ncbi:MAG TPA: hypothetical protein VMF06_13290 [Candidatus Limnocylindria bacterium]|jgi:hypothetical protein|nr:hypothetical protein [Candidatus Limnocylindria bacterium]
MKRALSFLAFGIIMLGVWVAWEFHPWMPAGQAVRLSVTRIGSIDLQVWQRKNSSSTEPFGTGLFAREGNQKWRVFFLGFEDLYRPRISLRSEGTEIAVYEGSQKLGTLDPKLEFFKRGGDGALLPPTVIDGNPPANWWK